MTDEEAKTTGESKRPIKATKATPLTPTNQAIYEAGKTMLIESVSTGREFCKFMIGTSMSAIPIYLALLKFVLPDKYVPTLSIGILALLPAVVFLIAGVIFMFGYFPQPGTASLDRPAEIEEERRLTLKRRHRLSGIGFSVFCVGVVAGLIITGAMLRMPRDAGSPARSDGGTEQVAPLDRRQPPASPPSVRDK